MLDSFLVIAGPSGYSVLAPFGALVFHSADKALCEECCERLNTDPPGPARLAAILDAAQEQPRLR